MACTHVMDMAHLCQVGGQGVIVEIDESKFGKRYYNRGKRVKGNWVFGGIKRIPVVDDKKNKKDKSVKQQKGEKKEKKWQAGQFFAVVVGDRTRETLKQEIFRYICPGSLVISDGWAAYRGLDEWFDVDAEGNVLPKNYQHLTVIHEDTFVDQDTGACTNTIESHWHVAKADIPKRIWSDSEMLQEYLTTQVFLSEHDGNLWEATINALSETKYLESIENGTFFCVKSQIS